MSFRGKRGGEKMKKPMLLLMALVLTSAAAVALADAAIDETSFPPRYSGHKYRKALL